MLVTFLENSHVYGIHTFISLINSGCTFIILLLRKYSLIKLCIFGIHDIVPLFKKFTVKDFIFIKVSFSHRLRKMWSRKLLFNSVSYKIKGSSVYQDWYAYYNLGNSELEIRFPPTNFRTNFVLYEILNERIFLLLSWRYTFLVIHT